MASATDNFNRADSSDLGTNWSVQTGEGAWKIVSNQAEPSSLEGDAVENYNAITFANDQYSEATIKALTAAAGLGRGPGVACRCSTSAHTYYRSIATTTVSGDNHELLKVVAGSYTSLATADADFAINDVMRIEAQGTTIRTKKNGTTQISVTDSSIASGRGGVGYSSSAESAQLDDWAGGDLAAGSLPPRRRKPMLAHLAR